ncbi:MAG: thiamine phosphate synthase [Chloroflexi bacterium]|nr:thiamine phosphate synthase [Chloroflexota bacterium]
MRVDADEARPARRRRLERERLYLVTDDRLELPVLLERLGAALGAGARVVQFRNKRVERGRFLREAAAVQEACRSSDALFIVNDAVEVAMLLKADGVHIGQEDLPPAAVRSLVGDEMLIGLSVSYPWEAEAAAREGIVDYLGVGAMYTTGTKPAAEYGGLELLEEVRRQTRLPLVAIGGIDVELAAPVFERGADLVAVVSAVFSTAESGLAVKALLESGRRTRPSRT